LPIALVEAEQQVQGKRDGSQRPGTSSHDRSQERLGVYAAVLCQKRRVPPGQRGKLNDTQMGQQTVEKLVQPRWVVCRPASDKQPKTAKIASCETSPQAPHEPPWLQGTLVHAVEHERQARRDGLFRFRSLVPTALIVRYPSKPLEGSHDEVLERRLVHIDEVDPRQTVLVNDVGPGLQVRDQASEAGALAHTGLPENH